MPRKRRRKATPKSREAVFQPPGTITYVGEVRSEKVTTETIYYTEEFFKKVSGIVPFTEQANVKWFNIDGVHDINVLKELGEHFNIHPLLVEDIANTTQRPKAELSENGIYQCLKMISYDSTDHDIKEEQVSIFITNQGVITFQEKTGDVFGNIRERLESSKGRIRKSDADYLFYALIDSVIDHYFIALEQIGDYLNDLEEEVFENATKESLDKVQHNKKVLLQLRRAIYPLRESMNRIIKDGSSFIQPEIMAYFHDAYDHCIQITETIESYRELNTGLKDMYLSSVSHKMNQIMQVLTIMSSIFIPLTFLAGVYGMNFKNIPELNWEHGYQFFWIASGVMFIGLLGFFKWKKWL